MTRLLSIAITVFLVGCAGTKPMLQDSAPERIIQVMVDAYEARDLDAMMAVFDEEIEWMSVEGRKIQLVATGRPALRGMMAENLAQFPDASWQVESMQRSGRFVTTTEYASWDGGASSLRNAVVYEIVDAQVRRIWFYPPSDS